MREKSLLKILDVLYDTAIERDSWPRVIEALAGPVGGATGHLLNWDKRTGLIPHYEAYAMDDSAMESYASHWVLQDPRAAYFMSHPQERIFSDEMYVSVQEKKRQAFFNEWEHRCTAQRYVVGHRVHQTRDREIIFSLGLGDPQGHRRNQAVEMFQQLGSHLQRAVEIHHLFGRHMVRHSPELHILDSLNFGVVFLDEQGRPGYYNRVAEQVSERGDGLRLFSGGLRARDGQSHSRLEAMVRTCRQQGGAGEAPTGGWISIARDNTGPDYSVLVIPMPDINDLHLFSHPRILVLISDPEEGRDDVGAALNHLYGLTEGEIRVCLSLVAGKDVSAIADELTVSREAVRFHLKNVYAKTRVKRQAQLIRLILTLPSAPFPVH